MFFKKEWLKERAPFCRSESGASFIFVEREAGTTLHFLGALPTSSHIYVLWFLNPIQCGGLCITHLNKTKKYGLPITKVINIAQWRKCYPVIRFALIEPINLKRPSCQLVKLPVQHPYQTCQISKLELTNLAPRSSGCRTRTNTSWELHSIVTSQRAQLVGWQTTRSVLPSATIPPSCYPTQLPSHPAAIPPSSDPTHMPSHTVATNHSILKEILTIFVYEI